MFRERTCIALKKQKVKEAIAKSNKQFFEKRAIAYAKLKNVESLRKEARRIKEEVIEKLPWYLTLFEGNAKKLGINIYKAENAEEAVAKVTAIAKAKNAKLIVKSKSMLTEEIALNKTLEEDFSVFETDLGEFIVQLANETPSHILTPAIHKTKEDVAKLFSEKLGTSPNLDINELTLVARNVLRDKFLKADIGITGANFAIAETGSIVIFENEGNAALTTTLPKVHIAVIGIEKLIPSLKDLSVFLQLLPASASGQSITSYMSIITGPKRKHNLEGVEELHVILLDNGRTKIMKNPYLKEILYCIRCGSCLNVCPVYQQIGGHPYKSTYPGPMGSVLSPLLFGYEEYYDLPEASTLCGRCKEYCPVEIDLPKLFLEIRNERVKKDMPLPKAMQEMEKLTVKIWTFMMLHEWMFSFASRLAYVITGSWIRKKWFSHLPLLFSKWTFARNFPPIAKKPFRVRWKKNEQ